MPQNNKKQSLSAADIESLQALKPGSVVDIQISTPTVPKRVKTVYVGMDYPRCLIFQIPNINKYGVLKDVMLPKSVVIVRYVLEGDAGQVIAFKARISHSQTQPSHLFFTTFPSSLQSIGLRAEKRASPGIASELTFADKSTAKSLIVDVSQSGCRLAVEQNDIRSLKEESLDENQPLTICVDLSDKTVLLKSHIRNIKQEDDYIFVGVQFDTLSSDIDVLLKRHIINI